MVFVKAHTRMTVTDSCGDVQIDQFHPLSDRYGEVWKSVRDVVSTYCRKRRCVST